MTAAESQGCGKKLLAEALATRAGTGFLHVRVPRLAIEVVHFGGKVGELLEVWTSTLAEMPPLTVFFEELEFSQAAEIGARRTDLPVAMDFLQSSWIGDLRHEHAGRRLDGAPNRARRLRGARARWIVSDAHLPHDVVKRSGSTPPRRSARRAAVFEASTGSRSCASTARRRSATGSA
jgi:hypothetical protein